MQDVSPGDPQPYHTVYVEARGSAYWGLFYVSNWLFYTAKKGSRLLAPFLMLAALVSLMLDILAYPFRLMCLSCGVAHELERPRNVTIYLLTTDVIGNQFGTTSWHQEGYRCVLQTNYDGPSYELGFSSTHRVGYQRSALEEFISMLSGPDHQPCRLFWNRMVLDYAADELAPEISPEQMRRRLNNIQITGCPC